MIMTLQDIKDLKKQLGLTNAHLAALSGVPLSTVQKVLGNTTSAPRQATLRRLEDALIRELGNSKRPVSERTESGTCYPGETALECCTGSPGYSRPDQGIFAGETAAPYHIDPASKGIHTIKDYYYERFAHCYITDAGSYSRRYGYI